MKPFVSIIIPTKNEEKYIEKCIKSLMETDYPKDKFELIIVDGGSTDKTVDIIEKLQMVHKNIRFKLAQETNTSVARNIALMKAKGEIIINFSAHTIAESNFISVLLTKLQRSDDIVVGVGCGDRIPSDQMCSLPLYIDYVMNTLLGGSIFHRSLLLNDEGLVDCVSFAAYRKKVFKDVGFFDPKIPSGDDAEFNLRVRKAGYKLFYTPLTRVYRYRRDSFKAFFRQMFEYGRSRMRIMKKHTDSIKFIHLVPGLFVTYLFLYFLVSIFLSCNTLIFEVLTLGIFAYVFLLLSFSLKLFLSKGDPKILIVCPFLYFIQHFSYGLGLLLGILT